MKKKREADLSAALDTAMRLHGDAMVRAKKAETDLFVAMLLIRSLSRNCEDNHAKPEDPYQRSWCMDCREWCYPSLGGLGDQGLRCTGCAIRDFLEGHEDIPAPSASVHLRRDR